MKIKILWGFKSEVGRVPEAENGLVRAGLVTTVDDQYAYELIGRGLAKAYGDEDAAAEQTARDNEGRHGQAEAALASRSRALDDQLADLAQREIALNNAHDELRLRGEELDAREVDVARREGDLRDAPKPIPDADGKEGDGTAKPGSAPKKTKPAAPAETK